MEELKKWNVTYTKHIHQKRKIYQDGILELNEAGKKVLLYDDTKKLVDSRCLKKDEVIVSGGSLAFNSYLVDIGHCEEKQNLLSHLAVNYKLKKSDEHIKDEVKLQNVDQNLSEWNVLYTTQITQKSKKYRDGILQVAGCGSHTKQVILLSEDRSILSSKYLKTVDFLKAGISFELPSYLVQICEAQNIQEEDTGKKCSSKDAAVITSNAPQISLKIKFNGNKPLYDTAKKSMPLKLAGTGSLKVGKFPCNDGVSTNKKFRDVSQILSHLQKTGNHGPETSSLEQAQTLNSSLSDDWYMDKTLNCMTADADNSNISAEPGVELQLKNANEVSNLHVSTLTNVVCQAFDNQQKPRAGLSFVSASLSSSTWKLTSTPDKKYSMDSESVIDTLNVHSEQCQDNGFPKGCSSSDMEIYCNVKDEISSQAADAWARCRDKIDCVPPADISSSVQASPIPAPPNVPSEPSIVSRKGRLMDDIPSFDLGF